MKHMGGNRSRFFSMALSVIKGKDSLLKRRVVQNLHSRLQKKRLYNATYEKN